MIHYTAGADDLSRHRLQVSVEVPPTPEPTFDLVLPSWVPGSYHIDHHARGVSGFSASGLGSDDRRSVTRVDKARWRVAANSGEPTRVRYQVYGHQMINEAVDVTPDHLFLNAALALMYVEGRKDEPHEITLDLPAGWRAYTELAEVSRHPLRFRARNYDELVDSPIDCGTPVELNLVAGGVPHRILLCGHGGNFEAHRLEEDLKKIAESTIRYFGESPVAHYTFFYHLNDTTDGALEHASSFSAVIPRQSFQPTKDYEHFLLVTGHEYLHLYLVKRIRPKVFGPFDYTKENYTRLLWLMEGTTDYVSLLLLRRAGLFSTKRMLQELAKLAQRHLHAPGRALMSLEDASLSAWVDFYYPYEETPNQSISYYLKGALVSFCLDMELRERTENRHSLDTLLHHLWSEYGRVGRGLGEDELLPLVETLAGTDLHPFFARYISGTEEIDFDRFARVAGLRFRPREKPPDDDPEPEPGYLGIEFREVGGLTRVTSVLDGGPGRRAGLSPGDEIIALNGAKVTGKKFTDSLKRFPPGTRVEVGLFRRGWLTHLPVEMGKAPPEKYEFTPLESPTALQRAVYETWLETGWPAPPKSGETAVGKS